MNVTLENVSYSESKKEKDSAKKSSTIRKVYTKEQILIKSIDFGLPVLTLNQFVNILNSELSKKKLSEKLLRFNLGSGIAQLSEQASLNLLNTLIILKSVYPKITKELIKTLLDSKKINPMEKDRYNCSPMFYSKLFGDVQITSLLFDYIVHAKK